MAQSKPADVGFGYISETTAPRHVEIQVGPASPGLKSAMKAPGTPGRRFDNPLSPTFMEEHKLEKQEKMTEKQQAKDLKVKTRIRIVKMLLRSVNFSCSLIVLALVATTLHIFLSTRNIAKKSNLPPWAKSTQTWPQYVVLACACISLAFCIMVFWSYYRGGHRRAEKTAVYYTIFAVGFFIFSIIMWAVAAGVLQGTRSNSGNQDIWGWSCVDNKRRDVYSEDIDYELVCRVQAWALICCIIEIVVETITIAIYGIIFYRYYSKRQLRKSMDTRDKARSDLYLAQLRSQSAPNTPGFPGMKSPRFPPPSHQSPNPLGDAEEGNSPVRFVDPTMSPATEKKEFKLQPPPIRVHAASPMVGRGEWSNPLDNQSGSTNAPAAEGERQYAAVPIPGAYAPLSPDVHQTSFMSPPTSPRPRYM